MLTLFALPKAFHGHIATIQRNAITSWTLLQPRPQILIFGNEEGVQDFTERFHLKHIPEIARNEFGTPLLNDLFEKAAQLAEHDLLCYVNSDVILFDNLLQVVKDLVSKRFKQFLLIGRRLALEIPEPIDFNQSDWQDQLREKMKKGTLEGPDAIEYFIFPKDLLWEMPPFAIGRTVWDNWIIYRARSKHVPVIDATELIPIIHQNHGYEHHPEGFAGVWKGPEAQRNLALAGGHEYIFTINDADYVLTSRGLQTPKWTRSRLIRNQYVQAVLDPKPAYWSTLMKRLFAPRSVTDVAVKARQVKEWINR